MKILFELYEYLYYRIFLWQKKLNGEKWAMFSAGYLPTILFCVHFILPILLLLDLCLGSMNDEIVIVISFISIVYFSVNLDNRHESIIDNYKNISKINNKIYLRKIWFLIVLTIAWLIIIFIIYQLLRPDEIQSPYPSEEVIKQLRNIRNSNIE